MNLYTVYTICLIAAASFFPGSIHAQDKVQEADEFNRFSVVLMSYMRATDKVDASKQKDWAADHTKTFASYYYQTEDQLQSSVEQIKSFFDNFATAGPKKEGIQHYFEVLDYLISTEQISSPKDNPCAKSYQRSYFQCILQNLDVLNQDLDKGLRSVQICTQTAKEKFDSCVE